MHKVKAKGILSAQNGMNIYRGCTHGCIYCDSRSRCYQMNHAFEDVEVKINAPELLEQVLRKKRKKCMIGTGAMSDPYIHLEEELRLTRSCLQLIRDYGFGLAIQTKSARILRDLDLLLAINEKAKCVVQMTLTTYDDNLCKILEPHVSTTSERFEVLKVLRDQGIPTIVWLCPILPLINDTEENVRGLMDYCIKAKVKGVICFGMGLTLREGNREYFYEKLDEHFPGMKEQYMARYGNLYQLASPRHEKLLRIFGDLCETNGIMSSVSGCFDYLHEFEEKGPQQMSLPLGDF
ncbi:MAG TPA: radical SAM protein [Firmicutes bacterium]|nr:radical SAM protein [Bacillota bacterium]